MLAKSFRNVIFLGTLLIIGGTFGAPISARAAAPSELEKPSFDCEKTSNKAEELICTDSALGPLDAALNRAWQERRQAVSTSARDQLVAEQKAWLRQRNNGCPMPTETETDVRGRLRAVPCLIEMYRRRIVELGGRLPPLPSADPSVLHPFCLSALWSVGEMNNDKRPTKVSIDLAECRAGTAHIPVTNEGRYRNAEHVNYQYSAGYFGYAVIGRTANGLELYEVSENSGGTGVFSAILVVRNDGRKLELVRSFSFGDRCNGGVSSSAMGPNGEIRVKAFLSPGDLGGVMAEIAGRPSEDPAYAGLMSCAACCYALGLQELDPNTGALNTVGVEFTEQIGLEDAGDSENARCLYQAVRAAAPRIPAVLNLDGLRAMNDAYLNACRKR